MSTKINVNVDESTRDLMQRVWLDYTYKKEIVRGIIEDHKYDDDDSIINSVVFKSYEKQSQECMVAYETACKELTNRYVPEHIKNKQYSWNLDFDKCILEITVHGDDAV